ncbi:MAG: cytidine deaminase, partial [Planctomycetaceae bacterium]
AAILTDDGKVFVGCNVENASFGLTICAERVAAATAVAAGEKNFVQLALSLPEGGSPCGACRQVLSEFCDNLEIFIDDSDREDSVRETTLAELLPDQFTFEA